MSDKVVSIIVVSPGTCKVAAIPLLKVLMITMILGSYSQLLPGALAAFVEHLMCAVAICLTLHIILMLLSFPRCHI